MRQESRSAAARERFETTCSPSSHSLRRRPQDTVLYRVVQENYRSFVAVCEEADRPLPRFVRRESEEYLACGILSEGFARIRCNECGHDRLVGSSCKHRAFCPSCLGRRMNDGAAYLAHCVLGAPPIRHWILTLPPPLRHLVAYKPSLVTEVLGAFIDSVFQYLRWKAKDCSGLRSVNETYPGSVTAIQRASSSLALDLHFHALVTDGVFVQETPEEQAPVLTARAAELASEEPGCRLETEGCRNYD